MENSSETVFFHSPNSTLALLKESEWGVPAIKKSLNSEFPNYLKTREFLNEYEISKDFKGQGLRRALGKNKPGTPLAIYLEYLNGKVLNDLIPDDRMDLRSFFRYAIQSAAALARLHSFNIIHRDISSLNILADPETQSVTLIDFGIASKVTLKEQFLSNPEKLQGNLSFISPEQTGRINRRIDFTTDLYSLGVTFYLMATGKLPFESEDPLELIHMHIAQTAESPHFLRKEIPETVSEIILHLMDKESRNRYKSAEGLKFDLEKAENEFLTTGTVSSFSLGQEDYSGKFRISEKLYGREKEVGQLMNSFERVSEGNVELMMVSGYSGTGKSALVHEIHKPITAKKGYFIEGKFDQYQRNVPYYGITHSIIGFLNQLLTENEEILDAYRSRIKEALGNEAAVLIEVIPNLGHILGPQPEVTALSGKEAQNRFNFLFQKFIHSITSKEHPMVLFIDDLQWSDSGSLDLLRYLLTGEQIHYLLCIFAYRDNEVSQSHPFMIAVEEIRKSKTPIETIEVKNLNPEQVSELVADSLNVKPVVVDELSSLIYSKTKGNAFFTIRFLKSLFDQDRLKFKREIKAWQWSIEDIKALKITDNVVDLLTARLHQLPVETQLILKRAACIGNHFELSTVSLIHEKSKEETEADLSPALAEELIASQNETYFFVHDRILQATYLMIPDAEKQKLHLNIGRLLLKETPETEKDEYIFSIVNHMNQGIPILVDQNEKSALAGLNIKAGIKAKLSAAYQAAMEYSLTGISLLPPNHWQTDYALSLKLFQTAGETAYMSGHLEKVDHYLDAVLKNSTELLDKIPAYQTRISALKGQRKLEDAINVSLEVLRMLGIKLPENPGQFQILLGVLKMKFKLFGKNIPSLENLPEMKDPYKLASIEILSEMAPAVYYARPALLPLNIFAMVELSVRYGNTSASLFSYSTYGLILCGALREIETGYQFGILTLNLLKKPFATANLSKAYFTSYCFVMHWKLHLRETLPGLLEGYKAGLQTGDLEFAAFSGYIHGNHSYYSGRELPVIEKELESFSKSIHKLQQSISFHSNELYRQIVLNLMGKSEDVLILKGEAYNEEKAVPYQIEIGDRTTVFQFYTQKMVLHYLFYQFEEAVKFGEKARGYIDGVVALYNETIFHLFDCLCALKLYPNSDAVFQKKTKTKVNAALKLFRNWAKHAPMNHQHKLELLEAEWARVQDKRAEAETLYSLAFEHAEKNSFPNEAALIGEVAGNFFLKAGNEEKARQYFQKSYGAYQQWGAEAKATDLKSRFPKYIFVQERKAESIQGSTRHSVRPSIAADLSIDLNTIMKASLAISGEIFFGKLLSTLIKIVIENAGAQQGHLLLMEKGKLTIEASYTIKSGKVEVLKSIDPFNSGQIPELILTYVLRSKEPVVVSDATKNEQFGRDPLIISENLKSILCLPILFQGELTGILYLENNLVAGTFTPERIEILNLLSGQIATSINNARVYENLEQIVSERTVEIEEKRKELEISNRKSDELLLNILPEETAEELKKFGKAKARRFENVTILFSDIVNFSELSENLSPEELVNEIDDYFSLMDSLVKKCGLEKIKTIGDAYLCVAGLPSEDPDHARKAVSLAMKMQEEIIKRNILKKSQNKPEFEIRIGLNSGPLVAGVVGTYKFVYDIWGDSVNIAARMETKGEPGRVNISETTFSLIRDHFLCTPRGKIEAKNKGTLEMFFVDRELEKVRS